MHSNYDPGLKEKLPKTNKGSDIILNAHFRKFGDLIAKNLSDRRVHSGDYLYSLEPDIELLNLCREHTEKYKRETKAKTTVMLTHPLYLHLSHMHRIKSPSAEKDAEKYLDTLIKFLQMNQENSQVDVVILDTIYHYAAASSLWLEAGMVKDVIFTEYDGGAPIVLNEFGRFIEKQILFGGGYNGLCLANSIDCALYFMPSDNIWAIRDLVFRNPRDSSIPSGVPIVGLPRVARVEKSKTITLEDAAKMFNLKWNAA